MHRPRPYDHLADMLLEALRMGAFPMAEPERSEGLDAVAFYTADPRGVMPLSPRQGLHIPRSLKKTIRHRRFSLTCDRAFEEVVRRCADPRPHEDGTWINEAIVQLYAALHRRGCAHSVEAWRVDPATGQRRLVGGIYGVAVGAAFVGESMFCRPRPRLASGGRHPLDGTDASKVCLVALLAHLWRRGFALFDTQLVNPHLQRFGCCAMPLRAYLERLAEAASRTDVSFGRFDADAALRCALDWPDGPAAPLTPPSG